MDELSELLGVEAGKTKRIDGIKDLRDESDKDGIRVVIELKGDANNEVVLNQLYKHSRLKKPQLKRILRQFHQFKNCQLKKPNRPSN